MSPTERSSASPMPPAGKGDPASGSTWKKAIARWLKRCAVVVAVFIVASGVFLLVAEHETSKPEFCGSCHIMEPYFESWHADLHGGKLEIACVDCHYAPGERNTINAKLRGLSQVASYISGRYGATRPRAHVDNRSCLTSKCHGDMKFMDKELALGSVKFVHAKHLNVDDKRMAAAQKELEELAQALKQQLGEKRLGELEEIATHSAPARETTSRVNSLIATWNIDVNRANLFQYIYQQHRQVRLAQLADLQCTNCHSYVAPVAVSDTMSTSHRSPHESEAHHFTVKTTACITCHFNNESFNSGTASCLTCHTLPTKEILVHKEVQASQATKLATPELGKEPVKIDHKAMIERKVDCYACHADVATEDATVTRRDCERCHDRPEYFQEWKQPLSLDLVKRYHSAHVPGQKAKCLDCHSEIHHQVARGNEAGGKPEFLATSMANCDQCHPNHHSEQIKLLSGTGGVGVPKGDPNLMFGARTNCFGCHTDHTAAKDGTPTAQGSVSGCITCHGDRHAATYDKWKKGLQLVMVDADEAYANARKLLDGAKELDPDVRNQATELLDAALADLRLVKQGNGMHNMLYSVELLDSVTQRSQKAMSLIRSKAKKS